MAHARPHVLLVEDDADTREVLRLILESDGMIVTPAHDGLDALVQLDEIHSRDPLTPCAIVLDYMMPRFGGAQFRARQLTNPETADVPVILVSAVSGYSGSAREAAASIRGPSEADRSRRADRRRPAGERRLP